MVRAAVLAPGCVGLVDVHGEPEQDLRVFGGDEVRVVLARIRAGGVEVIEHDDDADGVSFKCVDPDGHRAEVYWEA
jgi:hypothetical protein